MTNNLKAIKRDSKTSGDLNNLRSKGFIPAILYGGNNPSLKISVEEKLLSKVFSSDSFLSTVIDLNIDGQTEKVIPRDISYHVISDKPIHIDFMRVAKGSKIILQIPVIFKNNKDWYQKRGKPYTLGICSWGIPGCGKTTFEKIVTSYLKRHLIIVDFSRIKNQRVADLIFFSEKINNIIIIIKYIFYILLQSKYSTH